MPTEVKYFEECKSINDLIKNKNEKSARNSLIKLLSKIEKSGDSYTPLLNHLIRTLGLYPYMKDEACLWEDVLAKNCFETEVSSNKSVILHREQSFLLKKLLEGKNIAVSAPTSFGKSFVVDAFIEIKKPKNVMILVPTIALTDETRRRIYKRFSNEYNIITTVNAELGEKNIFIFPQERALSYLTRITELDILIIDEFYKSSNEFEPDRSPSLIKAMIKLNSITKQKYYLAPNISSINENPFTRDMEILNVNFNTVFLETHNSYREIHNEEQKKEYIIHLLQSLDSKTLVYAGTYSNIKSLSELFIEKIENQDYPILEDFSNWLEDNYTVDWTLPKLIKKGIGIHSGKIHRSLSQLQIKIFEVTKGLNTIISTSSIIEGVNTSAENVILWTKKNGPHNLNSFSYKNVIGRAGRMFRYFIGNIYILDKPPEEQAVQLNINFPEEILGDLDSEQSDGILTKEQIAKIKTYEQEMSQILGTNKFNELKQKSMFQSSDSFFIKNLAISIYSNKKDWKNLKWLNSENPDDWDFMLYKILRLQGSVWGAKYSSFIAFIKILSESWNKSIKELLAELEPYTITLEDFFNLERSVTFNLSSLLKDINILQLSILKENGTDISPFINKISSAFLPPLVFELEEYGLPRMISKKINDSKIIDLENDCSINEVIDKFQEIGKEKVIEAINASNFEKYIVEYFFDGITIEE